MLCTHDFTASSIPLFRSKFRQLLEMWKDLCAAALVLVFLFHADLGLLQTFFPSMPPTFMGSAYLLAIHYKDARFIPSVIRASSS